MEDIFLRRPNNFFVPFQDPVAGANLIDPPLYPMFESYLPGEAHLVDLLQAVHMARLALGQAGAPGGAKLGGANRPMSAEHDEKPLTPEEMKENAMHVMDSDAHLAPDKVGVFFVQVWTNSSSTGMQHPRPVVCILYCIHVYATTSSSCSRWEITHQLV